MKNNKTQKEKKLFAESIDNKIKSVIAKGKNCKVVSEPKPKSGKGL